MGLRDRRVQLWLAACAIIVLMFIAWSLGWFGGEPVPPGALEGTVPQTR